jgi:alkanesulfonate monooxygenase SsuD/methylene tetrahydromethanopterin reductase-like flavin-dependent oxidoreductase (luciferase family)
MFLCNLITPIAGATKAEAEDRMAVIQKLPLEIDALSLLAEALNFDFGAKPIDEPLTTEELQGMQGMIGMRDGVLRASGKSNPSTRDFITFSGRAQVQDAIVGGPKEIADRLEELFEGRGCDGFVVAASYVPGSYADFVDHVVPSCRSAACSTRTMRARRCARISASSVRLLARGRPARKRRNRRTSSCAG